MALKPVLKVVNFAYNLPSTTRQVIEYVSVVRELGTPERGYTLR
jgi:hypothetical protein